MQPKLLTYGLWFLLMVAGGQVFAQSGTVKGTLLDKDGMPLPGTAIQIKGTTKGTQTDFSGKYAIDCQVGDVLVFSYVGFTNREMTVTAAMLSSKTVTRSEAVNTIETPAYSAALAGAVDSVEYTKDVTQSKMLYNRNGSYTDFNAIRNFTVKDSTVKLQFFKPNLFYEVRFNSSVGFQSVAKNTEPDLQSAFAQGRPVNGTVQWQGPETGEIFSFGPAVSNLTFDGSNYAYDTNGRLVNGSPEKKVLPYNNNVFTSAKLLSNNLGLLLANKNHELDVNLRRKSREDLFGVEKGHATFIDLGYEFKRNLKVFLNANNEVFGQPDVNGFYSNLLQSVYSTPVSFQNSQGYRFADGTQRSFSPANDNNPLWLLHTNQNKLTNRYVLAGANGNVRLNGHLDLDARMSFNRDEADTRFALPANTVGFEDGYRSRKDIVNTSLQGYTKITFDKNYPYFANVTLSSSVAYNHNGMDYLLTEASGFNGFTFTNPSSETICTQNLQSNTVRLHNELELHPDMDFYTNIVLRNNSVINNWQGTELFLPAVNVYARLSSLLGYSDVIDHLSVSAGYSRDATEMPLYYSNQSHNSLLTSAQQAMSFTANNDLFNAKNLNFETTSNIDAGFNIELFNNLADLSVNYFSSYAHNTIFPVITNGGFELENIAHVRNRGLEADLVLYIRDWNGDFSYTPEITFTTTKATVTKLNGGRTSIPIAGFTEVTGNLVAGQKAGAIVGSVYLRDEQGHKIIGSDGFPLVASEKEVIGNTTPDFTIGFQHKIEFKNLELNFLIDWQHGGDVWNGTQSVLNYMGRSQESANLRGVTNYVFSGVNQAGEVNTVPVAFADANTAVTDNRWVRYGYTGVGEDAIADGSYLNLKNISLTYTFSHRNNGNFFRQLEVGVYANNLFTYTKTRGVVPGASLFNYDSGRGFNFFNMPLLKEIGATVNIKI